MTARLTRIHDILARHIAERPNAEAVVDGDVRWTYRELGSQVDAIAKGLLAIGIAPGDRVSSLVPPSKEFFITYLAATSIGAIWMGLNPRYKERDYAFLLEDSEPALIFVTSPYDGRDYDAELQAITDKVPCYVTFGTPQGKALTPDVFLAAGQNIADEELAARRAMVTADDIAVIVYTSGTTGKPKGAMLSHRAITSIAQINVDWMGDGLESTICPAPINHVGGLNNVCMNVFAYGGRIIFFHRVDAVELVRLNVEEQPTYLVSSPTAFSMLLDNPAFDLMLLSSLKLIVYGGATTPQNVLEQFEPLGAKMACVYGQTETCGICTGTKFDDPIEVRANTIGKGLDGVDIRIVDADGNDCAREQSGELLVKADFIMSGYYKRPDATAETITDDGYLHTGDICQWRNDGNIEFIGRIKEMFKSGGYNIYPLEIEQAIAEHPKVSMACVMAMPDPKFQEVGFAWVAPKPGLSLTSEELKSFLNERIANFKIPKEFAVEEVLPTLPNSKVDKQTLKAMLQARLEG